MEQLALIFGEPLQRLPRDLYIPPDALRVLLLSFEGPLDLLLYLIRKNNVSIHDIPVAEITAQYLEYIAMMQQLDMNLAAEYLLMAATLTEIKARLMLPQARLQALATAPDEDDPRAALSAQLAQYAATRQAALQLEHMPRLGQGLHLSAYPLDLPPLPPPAQPARLHWAMLALLERQAFAQEHEIQDEGESLPARLAHWQQHLPADWCSLSSQRRPGAGRHDLILDVLALLELDKAQQLSWRQEALFAEIFIRRREALH